MILFFVISKCAIGQEWDLIPSPIIESIVAIESIKNEIHNNQLIETTSYGTGVVIEITNKEYPTEQFKGWYVGKILTAAHIDGKLRVRFITDEISDANTIKEDKELDIKLITAYIPKGVGYTPVGKINGEILVNGMGGAGGEKPSLESVRCFSSKKIGPEDELFLDGFVIPGDSGGPIISNGFVVSIVSGGYEWFKDKIKYTFPIRGISNTNLLRFLDVKN